ELARQRIYIDLSGWNRSSEQVPHLPLLQDAVWRDRKVRMMYGDECPSERVVDPLGLVAKGSIWYLVAQIDASIRSYRVSRVHDQIEILEPQSLRESVVATARRIATAGA